ncbi:hypothetical protein K2173_021966 [Erythroxylum novogranatense]|uniref:Nodulin-related protein 1 n=1 Tax=Erythroxylum novogranatense TaxID=1862640 RepID=A0AAV8T3Y3_9ROSI|nr:hypothetical protein K2173_021966 [Erythroxylum novogranatense]
MEPTESHHKPSKHHQTSSSDLLSSAKLVAEAAQATFRHDTDKLDKGRVAGAAADLLDAASHYGKLDENKGIGNYMEKAENYLRQYHTSHSTTTATPTTYSAPGHGETRPAPSHGIDYSGEEKKSEGLKMAQGFLKSDETKPSSHGSEGGQKKSESGYGDYMKMAQGFMKGHETKPSSHGSEGGGEKKSEAGFGDYLKMAEGFLKK